MYCGERRYNETNYKINQVNTYKNLHNYSFIEEESIKFMNSYYSGYDENIK